MLNWMLYDCSFSFCLVLCDVRSGLLLCYLQSRQEVAQEYEIVKDINGTLSSLKTDSPKVGSEARQFEEPTRDPDVWPPPTPVEHRWVNLH
jgi:hypothetical protein